MTWLNGGLVTMQQVAQATRAPKVLAKKPNQNKTKVELA